jgi:hypothetical protein
MNSVVRIVKRGKVETEADKQDRKAPSEREIASTIKGWITDWEQRRRIGEHSNWNTLSKFAQ